MTEKPTPLQATYAHAAINYYARIANRDPVILGPEHPKDCHGNEATLTAFLAALHHLCDVLGMDYYRVAAIGNLHYEQERHEGRSI